MSTPTDTRPELLTVVATLRALPGQEERLREALLALVGPTTGERGCVNYDLHQGVEDPCEFAFYENWVSGEDLDAHLAAPHLTALGATVAELLDGPLVVRRMRRIG